MGTRGTLAAFLGRLLRPARAWLSDPLGARYLAPLPRVDGVIADLPGGFRAFADSEAGGRSTCQVTWRPESGGAPPEERGGGEPEGRLSMEGVYSVNIRDDIPFNRLRRSGFAGMTYDFLANEGRFGELGGYDAIEMCVRTDGRPYVVSLRTDDWVVPEGAPKLLDAHQAFIFSPPGVWHVGRVPLDRFRRTHRGKLIEEATEELNPDRIAALSIGVGGAAPDIAAAKLEAASKGGVAEAAYARAVSDEAMRAQESTAFSFELAWIRKARALS